MRNMNYTLLNRFLLRSEEIANEPTMSSIVKHVYDEALKEKSAVYRAAFNAIAVEESNSEAGRHEAKSALEELGGLYNAARSAVLAIHPTKVLPAPLSAQKTDTDTLYAIQTLVAVVGSFAGQAWADDLLGGPFGQASAKAMKELSDSIEVNKALAKATAERAGAFEPAYKAFVAFRRVVKNTLGPKSKQYQRLRVRSSAGAASDSDEAEVNEEVAPAEGASAPPAAETQSPVDGPAPAPVPVPVPAPAPLSTPAPVSVG